MRIYIDQDYYRFVSDPLYKTSVDSLRFKRGDKASLVLSFVSGSTALSAVSGRLINFGVKESGKYDGSYVTSASAYSIVNNNYVLNPSFNTTVLNSLLSSGDGDGDNDIASVTLMGEITWSDDNGENWQSTNTINIVVDNDVNKGIEGTALEMPSPEDWLGNQVLVLEDAPKNDWESLILTSSPADALADGTYNKAATQFYSLWHYVKLDAPELIIYFDESSELWCVYDGEQNIATNARDLGETPLPNPPLSGWVSTYETPPVLTLEKNYTQSTHLGQLAIFGDLVYCNVQIPAKWVALNL